MSENKPSNLPFSSEDVAENELWKSLGTLPAEEPSTRLRQEFYRKLELVSQPTVVARLRGLLGFSGNVGWITAAACVLLGLGVGQFLDDAGSGDAVRLAALEENVSMLNRNLILDRLENDTASKRLRGVIDAAYLVGDDSEIANALLRRATEDRVQSVRSAAIDALGSQLGTPTVGEQLMDMLQQSDTPLVQLALVDLVLRNGSQQQVELLLSLVDGGRLHPDLARHVLTSLNRDIT